MYHERGEDGLLLLGSVHVSYSKFLVFMWACGLMFLRSVDYAEEIWSIDVSQRFPEDETHPSLTFWC